LSDAERVWGESELILKVKEPEPKEYGRLRAGLIVFCFLHLAANENLAQAIARSGVRALAYEAIELEDGSLPLLSAMSAIAGRLAVQIGAHYLLKGFGGMGLLLSGIPGTQKGKLVIVGAGTVGENAAIIALGLGAIVIVLDANPARLEAIARRCGDRLELLMASPDNLGRVLDGADLLISSVFIKGRRAPKVITTEMIRRVHKGGIAVDVSIDQGGSLETLDRPTSHDEPLIEREGVLHYAVPNIPALAPLTATPALCARSLPYVLEIAQKGLNGAVSANPALKKALVAF
jgi:alanine dehydrogenase